MFSFVCRPQSVFKHLVSVSIESASWNWRDGLVVNRICGSQRRPEFSPQVPYSASHTFLNSNSRGFGACFLPPIYRAHTCTHAHTNQNEISVLQKIDLILKANTIHSLQICRQIHITHKEVPAGVNYEPAREHERKLPCLH